jgi:hypothetical protein
MTLSQDEQIIVYVPEFLTKVATIMQEADPE